ncbi:MAG: VWA domain-containing protein, partial [Alphaproteobacteria bacterium]|nr:VWA domain-containing protein [Alphaproteobacteria bacterium]
MNDTPAPRPVDPQDGGRMPENIMHFCRVLRAAGLPVGPGKTLDAVRAVQAVGLEDRGDFYWALHAALINRRDQRDLFDQAYHVFWRNPKFLDRMMKMMLPELEGEM